ncbi:MAG: deoxyribonuclease IV [Acidobacteriota bacterium]
MKLGAHMSIRGGVHHAVERGAEVGCDAIQIFTKSSNQWHAKPLSDDEIDLFKRLQVETGISPVVAHSAYLINLATPDRKLYARSTAALGEELDRCEKLGIPFLVLHPGAHTGSGEEAGIARIARALDRLFDRRRHYRAHLLLETTAGQGSCIGHRFEHLRDIIQRMALDDHVGVCFDTCHVFAAGYDLRTTKGYHEVMDQFDQCVGLSRLGAFHLNDCKKPLGSRADRHEQIGKGFIGLEAFRCLMNDPRFTQIPMLLETPKGPDCAEDRVNLRLLRSLAGSRRAQRGRARRGAG